MKIYVKQILLIVISAFVLSFFRYLFLDDYDLIKKNKLKEENIKVENNNLYDFIKYTESPKLVDLSIAKSLYDNNLVTFIDARDTDSYYENHIKNAINLPYEDIDEIVNSYDLSYYSEIGDDFISEGILTGNNNSFYFGLKNGNVFISNKSEINLLNEKHIAFLIYCSGEGCSLSEDLAFYLFENFNIKKIFIYEGGMPEWINNNFPISRW